MAEPFKFAQREHKRRSRDWSGWCLVFVRSCFGVAARYPSATSAWQHAEHRHRTTDPDAIPRGVPVFWTGGSQGFGHVALSRGDGTCWTTDLIRPGHVDVAPIAEVQRRWGMPLVGWTEDINGVRVWSPPAPKRPKRKPKTTRTSKARDLLGKALRWSRRHDRKGRARRIRKALDTLPKK